MNHAGTSEGPRRMGLPRAARGYGAASARFQPTSNLEADR
jgi:hypothetical protein